MRLFDIYNQSYKSGLFIAEDDGEAVAIAKETNHLRKGLPRRLYERTEGDIRSLYPKPCKILDTLAAGKAGSLRFERSNQSWVFEPR